MIDAIAGEVNARLEEEEADLGQKPTIYLLIYGLQRARDLRPQESMGFGSYGGYDDEFGADPPPPRPDQQFPTILREGPDMGVHSFIWCDTGTNLERTLDWQSLREFEMRIAFQMGNEDSTKLVDSPAASKLGSYRAIYYSEDDGRLEKFRPYSLPSQAWLAEMAGVLSGRANL